MPQMANITVKKVDGTTDVVFNALTASGGDSTPAVWRVDAANAIPKLRPMIQMKSSYNGPRTARNVRTTVSFPYADANGVELGRVPIEISVLVPSQVPDTFVKEAVYQTTNFLCNASIRDALYLGYAPV